MFRLTDGPEFIPWATNRLLATPLSPTSLFHPLPPPLLRQLISSLPLLTPPVESLHLSPPPPHLPSTSPSLSLFFPRHPLAGDAFATPRPNPLVFLHAVTARAVGPPFLCPFLRCRANVRRSEGSEATRCNGRFRRTSHAGGVSPPRAGSIGLKLRLAPGNGNYGELGCWSVLKLTH